MSYGQRPAVPWYRRLLIWLGFRPDPLDDSYGYTAYRSEPRQPAPDLEDVLHIQRLEFDSPAQGDSFNFKIKARCTWHGKVPVLDVEQLRKDIVNRGREIAEGELETAVRTITRQHGPQDCADVERRINELSYPWPVDGLGDITCKVQAQVEPDVAIRDMQRKTGLRSIQIAHECEATHQQIHRLRGDVSLWRKLLEEWPGDQATTDAVVLTLRPGELEAIVSRPQVNPDSERQHLIAEASRWLERVQEYGWDEALFRFDSALRRLTEHLDIAPPSRTAIGGDHHVEVNRRERLTNEGNGEPWDRRQDGETDVRPESGPGGQT